MNVVVTREAGTNEVLASWLPAGTSIEEVPLTTTEYFERDQVHAVLGRFTNEPFRTLVITSERSTRYVDMAIAASTPDVVVCCVGPTSANALGDLGVRVDAVSDAGAEALASAITRDPVLLLGAKSMRAELAMALRAKGLVVESVTCYETIGLELDAPQVSKIRTADALFIGAPSAWRVAREFVDHDAWVVVPGATTAAAVREDHSRIIEGWGPQLRERLAELSRAG